MAFMKKTADLSKLRAGVTKNILSNGRGSIGYNDPSVWVDTGNYTLNYSISGDFNKGIPLGKVTCLAGESGSAKSYIASANIVRNAQKQGIFVMLIDSEGALDETWLKKLGVDTSEDKLLKINVAMIDDVSKIISDFMKSYRDEYGNLEKDDRPQVLIVIDSLGMLLTPTEVDQFEKGEMKGDMGRKAKQLKTFVSNCVVMFDNHNIGMVATNHTYASQDMFDPDDKVSGGSGFVYASSILVAMKKRKLKEDEDGNKISEVTGIRSACKLIKSRFNNTMLYKTIEVKIDFDRGMDQYSGLFDLFETLGIVKKDGNKFFYNTLDGKEIKEFRKKFTKDILDTIVLEFPEKIKTLVHTKEEPLLS